MTLEEKIARIYAKNEGFDPDYAHFEHKNKEFRDENGVLAGVRLVFEDSGKKKWELFVGRAKSSIEIFELLKEELR